MHIPVVDDELESLPAAAAGESDPAPSQSARDVLIAQNETLRMFRTGASDQSMAIIDVLRTEIAAGLERESALAAKLKGSERREAAAIAEAEQLRAALSKEKESASAAVRRAAWDLRKRDEAAASAAAAATAALAEADEKSNAVLEKVKGQLKQRERQLHDAQAQIKSLRRAAAEETLREQQASFLDGGSSNMTAAAASTAKQHAPRHRAPLATTTTRQPAASGTAAAVATRAASRKLCGSDASRSVEDESIQSDVTEVANEEDISTLQGAFMARLGL